jgi:hypothetical protein
MDARSFEKSPQMNFAQFWDLYPRKVSRKDAEKAWLTLTDEQRFAAVESLPVHVRYWKASATGKEFLPYPATWLRGERWTDELEMPAAPNPLGEWWKSTAGIEAKARELGVSARPGEGHHELKARILAKERVA